MIFLIKVLRHKPGDLVLLEPDHPIWTLMPTAPHDKLITFVQDRPGHDRRYAIDASKIERELSWQPLETFESGIRKTIEWYLANAEWTRGVLTGSYRRWMALQYSL